jgi:truncated hemoglobin YjbI
MRAMRLAVDDTKISEPYRTQLLNYFKSTADHMVNVHA